MALREPQPPTLEELRARPIGRTGAQLIARLRLEGLLADYDPVAKVWRVATKDGLELMILGTDNLVHSAVVFAALAAVEGWAMPKLGAGYRWYPLERNAGSDPICAVMSQEQPGVFGLGANEAAAMADLARIREAVG